MNARDVIIAMDLLEAESDKTVPLETVHAACDKLFGKSAAGIKAHLGKMGDKITETNLKDACSKCGFGEHTEKLIGECFTKGE